MNAQLKTTIGLSEDNIDLSRAIVAINEAGREKSGDIAYLKPPSAPTLKLYQVLSVAADEDIHLVNSSSLKVKDKRRQMASTSVRNLASHIAAVSYTNFIPTIEKWQGLMTSSW